MRDADAPRPARSGPAPPRASHHGSLRLRPGNSSGIGFTVAPFIAGLAFPGDAGLLDQATTGILAGSLAAGVVGAAILARTRPVASA